MQNVADTAIKSYVEQRTLQRCESAAKSGDGNDSLDSNGYSCINGGITSMNDSQEPPQAVALVVGVPVEPFRP
jgi:hypothetical protein